MPEQVAQYMANTYGDLYYINSDIIPGISLDTPRPIPGMHDLPSVAMQMYNEADTLLNRKTRLPFVGVPSAERRVIKVGKDLEDLADDPHNRLPESSRGLQVLVVMLGKPSPSNPTYIPVDKGDFKEALTRMPGPEPALDAIVEKARREGIVLNLGLYLNEIESPTTDVMTYQDA